jgi:hyperosmotically inducible periplasmic protein
MKNLFRKAACLLLVGAVVGVTAVVAQEPSGGQTPPPDNTKVNQRDRDQAATTADQQSNEKTDREITQQVRKALINDKSLSSYAHNVKIVTQNGVVTVKGPVRSEEEKNAIEAKAAEVSGKDVKSELSVAPKN